MDKPNRVPNGTPNASPQEPSDSLFEVFQMASQSFADCRKKTLLLEDKLKLLLHEKTSNLTFTISNIPELDIFIGFQLVEHISASVCSDDFRISSINSVNINFENPSISQWRGTLQSLNHPDPSGAFHFKSFLAKPNSSRSPDELIANLCRQLQESHCRSHCIGKKEARRIFFIEKNENTGILA